MDEIHPSYQTHILVALRDLPVGALLCETELASEFDRGTAFLYHNSPNVVISLSFPNRASPEWSGHFSWNTLELGWRGQYSRQYFCLLERIAVGPPPIDAQTPTSYNTS